MDSQLTWLLDEKLDEAGLSDLIPAIETVGDRYRPLSRNEARFGTAEQTILLHTCPTLAYGSVEFLKAVRPEFYPGKWCDWTELRYDRYGAKLGAFLLNDDFILLPAAEVRRRKTSLLRQWDPIFIRPARADKPFSGFVGTACEPEEIDRQLARAEAEDLVVLAPAKQIEAEYRTVVVRGKGVVVASQYMRDGQFDIQKQTPGEAREVAEAVVKALGNEFPDPMYIVDIARCRGGYRLLEINGFSFSIFYACDLEAIVAAAHEQALREWREIQL